MLYEAAIGMVKALKGVVRHNAVAFSLKRKGAREMAILLEKFGVIAISLGVVVLIADVPLSEETGPVLPGP